MCVCVCVCVRAHACFCRPPGVSAEARRWHSGVRSLLSSWAGSQVVRLGGCTLILRKSCSCLPCFCFLFMCIGVSCVCVREGVRYSETGYRQLWAARWVLGIGPRSPWRTTDALNHWAISLAFFFFFLKRLFVFFTSLFLFVFVFVCFCFRNDMSCWGCCPLCSRWQVWWRDFPVSTESGVEESFLSLLPRGSHSTVLGVEMPWIPAVFKPFAIAWKAFRERLACG